MAARESFAAAYQYAQDLIYTARHMPQRFSNCFKDDGPPTTLRDKLIHLNLNLPRHEEFATSNLLKKLVRSEEMNLLVVDLYPGDAGYTITVQTRLGHKAETKHIPYEHDKFLDYIDNCEIPDFLLEWFPHLSNDVFHSGCIVVEVRDHRRGQKGGWPDFKYVLLQPTVSSDVRELEFYLNETQLKDMPLLEQQKFEAKYLLETSAPLCLEPTVSVAIVANHMQHVKKPLSRPSVINHVDKQRHIRKRKLPVDCLELVNVSRYRNIPTIAASSHVDLLGFPPSEDCYRFMLDDHAYLEEWLRGLPLVEHPREDIREVMDEEYTIEIERRLENPKEEDDLERKSSMVLVQCTKVTIMRTLADDLYYGILSLSSDVKDHWTSSRFFLGSRAFVDMYIKQFKKIFTDDGSRKVRITHTVPGYKDEVYCTPAAREDFCTGNSWWRTAVPSKHSSSFSVENIISKPSSSSMSSEVHYLGTVHHHSDRLKTMSGSLSCYSDLNQGSSFVYTNDDSSMSTNSQDTIMPSIGVTSQNNNVAVSMAKVFSFQAVNPPSSSKTPSTTDLNVTTASHDLAHTEVITMGQGGTLGNSGYFKLLK